MTIHFPSQLLTHVVRPVLSSIGLPGIASEMLVIGTASQESQFSAIMQIGGGPAVSLWQMEPNTIRDTWIRAPMKIKRAIYGNAGLDVMAYNSTIGSYIFAKSALFDRLPGNLYLGAAMCRLIYYMKPFQLEALPGSGFSRWKDYIAFLWKQYYNTPQGAGTIEQFILHWNQFNLDLLWSEK